MADPALPSSIYLSWRMVMTTGWDIPWWIKHFFWMRILFSFFRWQRRATYFPVAEVLYHCAAQVHQRSMALVQQRYNAFHLRPNEMHFTVHFKSRGQAATARYLFDCHVSFNESGMSPTTSFVHPSTISPKCCPGNPTWFKQSPISNF